MSRTFGELRQIAYVVKDIDAAMKYWSDDMGIGPFFIKREIQFGDFFYRGEARESPSVSIALANSGAMQLELIQQHDTRPSIYREFLTSRGEGLQHMAAWHTAVEFDKRKAELAKRFQLVQACTIASSGVRLAYFATDGYQGGTIFEIADLLEPEQYQRITGIADAAREWDGRHAVVEVER